MPEAERTDELEPMILTLRIIVVSLSMGVLIFLGVIAGVVRSGKLLGPDPWSVKTLFTLVAAGLAVLDAGLSFVIPKLSIESQRRALAAGKWPQSSKPAASVVPPSEIAALFAIYQTSTIVGAALLEGGAFFCLIAYMIEGTAIPLVLAVILVGLILWRFPTREGVVAWIEDQRTQLRAEKLNS